MPSFRVAARWVRDESLPTPVRFVAMCRALKSYTWLTGQKFHATYARLGWHFGFDWARKPSGTQMLAALEVLHIERERVVLKLKRAAEMRRGEKARGRRTWKRAQYAWLFDPDFLQLPHPVIGAEKHESVERPDTGA